MKYSILTLSILISFMSYGQITDKEKAYGLALDAIELMDQGKIDESIDLLKQSEKLDQKNFAYPYELGYAYLMIEDYKKSIKMFEKTVKFEDCNDQCYQMLGNVYDISGDPDKAIEAYNKGLDKFPNSGRLHLELGNMQQDLNIALKYYEKGIELDPSYPSNYYHATKIFLNNTEVEVWGMIYGELFMNLEIGSERTEEISKMLFDTYKNEISFTSDSTFSASFCNISSITIPENEDIQEEIKLPFGLLIYEPVLMLSSIGVNFINLESLNEIRTNFLNIYFEEGFNNEYPNILFDRQKEILENGHFESYNYWLLGIGNENEIGDWINQNEERFGMFLDWFIENQIQINEENKFIRAE